MVHANALSHKGNSPYGCGDKKKYVGSKCASGQENSYVYYLVATSLKKGLISLGQGEKLIIIDNNCKKMSRSCRKK
jgi:hypothetical protein